MKIPSEELVFLREQAVINFTVSVPILAHLWPDTELNQHIPTTYHILIHCLFIQRNP